MNDPVATVPEWMDALDRIEVMLAQRLQDLPQVPEPPAGPPGIDAELLQRVDDRLARWHEGVERAEQLAQDAAADAEETLAAVAVWKDGLTAARGRLEAWLARTA